MNALVAIVLCTAQAFAKNPKLKYEPNIVELRGALDLQTFPGAPNYESVRKGDDPERHFYLKVDHPFDVDADPKGPVEEAVAERNVRIIQLSIDEEDDKLWKKFRSAGMGANVVISGTLFHRFDGHHHSRILMAVTKFETKP